MSIPEFREQISRSHTVAELSGLLNGSWPMVEGTADEKYAVFSELIGRREALARGQHEDDIVERAGCITAVHASGEAM